MGGVDVVAVLDVCFTSEVHLNGREVEMSHN